MAKQTGRVPHVCHQSEKIAEMFSKVERLDKIMNGNGKEGLYETVIKLNASIQKFTNETEHLTTAVSGLVRFQSEFEITAAEKAKYLAQRKKEKDEETAKRDLEMDKESARRRWVIGTIITLVSIIAGLVVALIK